MDPLQARLGNQVSPTLPMSSIPDAYRAGIPYFIFVFLAGFLYFSFIMLRERTLLPQGVAFALLCLGWAVACGVSLYRHRVRRWSLTLYEHGFALQRDGRTKSFLFEEIRELAIRETEQLNETARYGVVREVTVRSAADSLSFRFLSLDKNRDTSGEYLETIRACLAEAAGQRLRRGESVAGQGWTLTGGVLETARETVSLEMLSEAALYGSRVAVWKHGEETPWFSVPAHTPNALLLLDLLAAVLPPQPRRQEGLGRALFERRSQRRAVAAGLVIAAATLACLPWMGGPGSLRPVLQAFNAVIGVTLAVVSLLGAFQGIRCHERGIVRFSVFGRRQLLFSEVERLSCRTTRHYHNGVYTGTSFKMRLHPQEGRPMILSERTRGSLAELEGLRDRVAGLLADRLRERLVYEGEAPWTEGVSLTVEGVRARRRRRIGRPDETFAAFAQDLRFAIDKGTFQLFLPGNLKPVLSIPCHAEGFYPGFALFEKLADRGAGTGRDALSWRERSDSARL